MLELKVDESALRPLVRLVVAEVLAELERLQRFQQDRLVYSEAEAADMLGLRQHQLRDIRRESKIGHTTIVGRRIRYTLADLMTYLSRQHQEPEC
jgi:hypothetical protein